MPVFVCTGAHGFIGNNIVEKLLSLDPESIGLPHPTQKHFSDFDSISNKSSNISVIGSDFSTTFHRMTARRFIGSARFQMVDVDELISVLEKLPEKPAAVIHNGACSSTTETDPAIFKKLNLNSTKNLWTYCTQNSIPFIYASSAATYGDGHLGFSDKKEDSHKYNPLNLYGKSKLDFDLWAINQKQTPPTWFGLRYFNVFGPFEAHKEGQASMVYHGYQQATRTGEIRLFESNTPVYQAGEQERDFIYVEDIISITFKLLKICFARKDNPSSHSLPENGLILNVGRGIPEKWNTLATEVFHALSIKPQIKYIPIPKNIIHQYQNYTCADLSTLLSLGIEHTFHSFRESIEKYVQKHLLRGQ